MIVKIKTFSGESIYLDEEQYLENLYSSKDPSEMTDEELLGKKNHSGKKGAMRGALAGFTGGTIIGSIGSSRELKRGNLALWEKYKNKRGNGGVSPNGRKWAAINEGRVNNYKSAIKGVAATAAAGTLGGAIRGYVQGRKKSKEEDARRAENLKRLRANKENKQ